MGINELGRDLRRQSWVSLVFVVLRSAKEHPFAERTAMKLNHDLNTRLQHSCLARWREGFDHAFAFDVDRLDGADVVELT